MIASMLDHTAQLTGFVLVRETADQLYDDLAGTMAVAAAKAVDERQTFHLALSGGTTPEPLYTRLVIDPRYRHIPWQQTHVWLVDERNVPEDDPRHNFTMIRELLLDHVPLRQRRIHRMPVGAQDPATVYEAELKEHLPDGLLDFVLLGMGQDAHTASLFPGSPAQAVRDRWVALNAGPSVTPPDRVTMTYPLLNAARQVAVLVTGAAKASTVRRVAEHMQLKGPDPASLPITGIDPQDGEMTWFLDAEAAQGDC
jgi:6-phosphogluconolactonase